MYIMTIGGGIILPIVETNPGFFGLVSTVVSMLISLGIGVCAIRTVAQAVNVHRVSARFGFYVNLFGYLELFRSEMENGDALLSAFVPDELDRQKFFNGVAHKIPTADEIGRFSDLCKIFREFLLSSGDNVPPKRTPAIWKISKKSSREKWAEHQLTLVKFLHKGIRIGTVPYFSGKSGYANYTSEIKSVMDAISALMSVIKPEIGMAVNSEVDKQQPGQH